MTRRTAALAAALALAACSGGNTPDKKAHAPHTAKLQAIEVAPGTATRVAGEDQAFTATAVYDDGSRAPAQGAAWSSSDEIVATVAGTGVAHALAAGSTQIVARLNGRSGTALLTVTALPPPPPPPGPQVHLAITPDTITVGNDLFQRRWSRSPFMTEAFTDLRTAREWTPGGPDFALVIGGQDLTSDLLEVAAEPVVQQLAHGVVRLTLDLVPLGAGVLPLGLHVRRIVELYPDVAGMRQETWVDSPLPLVVDGYVLDQLALEGEGLSADLHSFRAGGDWREPGWEGPASAGGTGDIPLPLPVEGELPPLVIGDAHGGSWRSTVHSAGEPVTATAQWLSVDLAGSKLFLVMERNDYASSEMSFSASLAAARVDESRDVIYLGPIEETAHVENPGSGPARQRAVLPGIPLRLEPVFTGVGTSADDEPWQHYRYLAGYRMPPYRREVTFNSNGTDRDAISTGAKDDFDYATFHALVPVLRSLGIETVIFDDGWQARSGDWCPDAAVDDPACIEPRRWCPDHPEDPVCADPRSTDPVVSQPRFPDATFAAVRADLGTDMRLGLWMSPLHFNPSAVAFQDNPQWACLPIDGALLALQESDPYGGSQEAGLLQWNLQALGSDGQTRLVAFLESRIRTAIEQWGVRYFKFDFTVWLDCAGVDAVDMYGYRESFMAMLDRVLADHPDVTIQMDETNDYRLFPFEALARGPTWYQNGSPTPPEALHANWILTPFVPPYALGRNALRANDIGKWSVDYQMAVALLSHFTFFNDLRSIPKSIVDAAAVWTSYYKAHREDFAAFTYPLGTVNPSNPADAANDPYDGTHWAAFQTWNPDTGRGALLAYRQQSTQPTQTLKLRNIADGTYVLHAAPADELYGTFTGAQLRAGLLITRELPNTALVLRIERAE